jgi:hypothetical protein
MASLTRKLGNGPRVLAHSRPPDISLRPANMSRSALPLLTLPLVVSLALPMLAGCQTMSAAPDLAEVEAVERARFQAFIEGDTAPLRPMLADDLLYCHSSGQCETKEQIVASISSNAADYQKLDVVYLKPRAVGGAVLINGKVDVLVVDSGGTKQFQAIYTDVYVKRDGRWQLVSWQSTRLP